MILHFTKNPFTNKRIGHINFNKFVSEHLAALETSTEKAKLTTEITTLTALHTPYEKWLHTQDKDKIDKTGDTDDVDSIVVAFENFVRGDLYKDVAYHFNKQPLIVHQIYPHGKNEYHKISRTKAPILLQRVADFCAEHKAELDSGRDTESKKFLDDYNAQREKQLERKKTVVHGSNTGNDLRKAIAEYMYDVLLNLLIIHKPNRAAVLNYYNTSVFATATKKVAKQPEKE